MKFYSTNGSIQPVSAREAIVMGLAPDGGLFMPCQIPQLTPDFFTSLPNMSLAQIGMEVAGKFLYGDLTPVEIEQVVSESISFDAPLVEISEGIFSLELFHGPTLAFKDFGARFMARVIARFLSSRTEEITVLVATSGDTGSAVAQGFYGVPGTQVVLLYPKGKVSHLQEQQLTTVGGNVRALEIEGTFDDCQKMVKEAFLDPGVSAKRRLVSANSINFARLLPQSFYYLYALGCLMRQGVVSGKESAPIFSIPCGNLGNLTAGVLASRMGMPVAHFVAATNANKILPAYLEGAGFHPKPSVLTISNAMDVGNPSNFARLEKLYPGGLREMSKEIYGASFTDQATQETMTRVLSETGYILDPHGAVGYLGLQSLRLNRPEFRSNPGIFLETAHPAKFIDVVKDAIPGEHQILIPERLASCLHKQKITTLLKADYTQLREFLLDA